MKSRRPLAQKISGRSSSRRAKRKGVGGKEFLPACSARRRRAGGGKRFRRLALSQTSKQNNFQFLLKEKKAREIGIFVKKSSDFVQKVPPIFKIRILGDCCLALALSSPQFFVFRFAKCAAKECCPCPTRPYAGNDKELPKIWLLKFILSGSIKVSANISFTIILPKLYLYDKWKNNQREYQENAG